MARIMQTEELGVMSEGHYANWGQLAGYFDGDGSVGVDVQLFTLGMYLEFTDNWPGQLDEVETFLQRHGVTTYRPSTRGSGGAYTLKVLTISSVLEVAKRMLPYVCKKRTELKSVVDYYEGRITGQKVIESVNNEVRAGKRVGKMRVVGLPYPYEEGRKLAMDFTRKMAVQANTLRVPSKIQHSIIRDSLTRGVSQEKLARTYGLSRTVVRRILGVK